SCSCDSEARRRHARKSAPIEPSGGAAITSCSMPVPSSLALRKRWPQSGTRRDGRSGPTALRKDHAAASKRCLDGPHAHAAPPWPGGCPLPGPRDGRCCSSADDDAHVDDGQLPATGATGQDQGGAGGGLRIQNGGVTCLLGGSPGGEEFP